MLILNKKKIIWASVIISLDLLTADKIWPPLSYFYHHDLPGIEHYPLTLRFESGFYTAARREIHFVIYLWKKIFKLYYLIILWLNPFLASYKYVMESSIKIFQRILITSETLYCEVFLKTELFNTFLLFNLFKKKQFILCTLFCLGLTTYLGYLALCQ